jgi:predicted CoA-binding protein
MRWKEKVVWHQDGVKARESFRIFSDQGIKSKIVASRDGLNYSKYSIRNTI